ncbi:MAG: glycosyltransferase family 2 protein [Rhodospirillales bacterium]|jgi:hypothetical protein
MNFKALTPEMTMAKNRRIVDQPVDPRFSAIVVTFRTGSVLFDSLAALVEQPSVCEVIVVDNGNPDRVACDLDRLASTESKISLLRPGRNLGFASGCNLGAAQARGEYLAFVNPDLIVPIGSFDVIKGAIADYPDAWLLGARLLNMDGSEQKGGRREVLTPWRAIVELARLDRLAPSHPYFKRFHLQDGAPPDHPVEVPTISGAFMVVPRDRFSALSGFDQAMFLHIEDIDLCLRVLLAGGRVLYCGNVPVYHARSTSDTSRCFVEWHKTRSSIIYFLKHFRSSYPAWSLYLISAMLLLRFLLVAIQAAPKDGARLARRLAAGKGN